MKTRFKDLTLQIAAGANVATAAVMLLVGLSDRVNPASHPILACAGLVFPVFLLLNLLFLVFFIIVRWKYAIVPFVGLLVCYPSIRIYSPLNIGGAAPDGSLKVMSYNVCSFDSVKNSGGGAGKIISYIIDSGAEIACLQEAALTDDTRSLIARDYPYIDTVRSKNLGETVTLLSKYPILSRERIDYESKGNVSAAFKVKINGDTVTVINNHFETSGLSIADRKGFGNMVRGNSEADAIKKESRTLLTKLGRSAAIRAPQADAVAEYVRKCRGSVILCGDFNDNPISYTRRVLARELTDCYVSTGNGPGFSYHHNAMVVRIDNMMCSSDWQPYGCKVDRSVAYSDHYPISCWLKMKANSKKQR